MATKDQDQLERELFQEAETEFKEKQRERDKSLLEKTRGKIVYVDMDSSIRFTRYRELKGKIDRFDDKGQFEKADNLRSILEDLKEEERQILNRLNTLKESTNGKSYIIKVLLTMSRRE